MAISRREFVQRAGSVSAGMMVLSRVGSAGSARTTDLPLLGGNPIQPGSGLCDPQIRVYGENVYLYATHDASPKSPYYAMHDWWVWTTNDLVHWRQVSTLLPEQTFWRKPLDECWATDGISYKGKYYFYFSVGPEQIGVVVGNSPQGPWTDPLGKPLIAKGSTPTEARDPGILQEADGTTYLIFGLEDYYIARLNDDMISLAETPRKVAVDRKMGPYGQGKGDDKPFLHRRGGFCYLSWGCYYAMSENVYGPYVYKDTIIKENHTAAEFRKGLTMDRHGSFFELHGQWYFICNDQSWPGQGPYFRTSVLSYAHYRDNGEIATIELNRIGVGQYDARQPRIEAENYYKASGAEVKESADGGFEVRGLRDGSSLIYTNVQHLRRNCVASFRVACAQPHGASLEVRAGGSDGRLLGRCHIASNADWATWTTATCRLRNGEDPIDICLRFGGGEGELARLDWMSFESV